MNHREMYRRCAVLVDDLRLGGAFDVRTTCARLEEERGRPIYRMPMDLPSTGPCGLLVSTDAADYVVFARNTSSVHQAHIVWHEIAHLLLGHETSSAMADEVCLQVLPTLDPGMVRRVLGARTAYSEDEEQQAELVASIVLERSQWSRTRSLKDVSEADAQVVHRVQRTLQVVRTVCP